ncbi:MAG TPA: HD domain-containing protein [Gemmatimonadaceae bacterium]
MQQSEIDGVLEFLRSTEQLKNTLRSSWTSAGQPESVAQHTWRLCLMAMIFAPSYPDIDFAKLVKICIIHDLGEAIGGDIPAVDQVPGTSKAAKEREDLCTLLQPLPERLQQEITALWDEYEAAVSPEARLAKALDKMETIMQHNQGRNPADFDYRFNLEYGKRFTTGDPLIEAIRELLDRETAQRAAEASAGAATPRRP